MGCRELIESLRKAGDERIRAARAEAEQEIARIRADSSARIEAARQAHERTRAAEAERHGAVLLAEANADARRLRIKAERQLAGKLIAAARASLPSLRNVGYSDVFAGFVRELPPAVWKIVRVNSADVLLAREFFPGAEVIADDSITGGFAATAEDDWIRVVNTFEKRLERLWDEMLPDLVGEVKDMLT